MRRINSILIILFLCSYGMAHAARTSPFAGAHPTDTSNFAGNLSSADDTVQKALDTIDDMAGASAEVSDATVGGAGDGDTTHAYSKDDIHDYVNQHDSDFDGLPDGVEAGSIAASMVAADVATQAELDAVAALVDTDDEIIAIINASPSTQVGVPAGGTGAATLTDGGILLGSGTGAITALGVATNGQIPIGDGTTDPVLATITGTANEITVTNGAGTITIDIPSSPTLDGTNFTGIPSSGLADGDYGDISNSSGTITLDADVVAAAEMADADHGDVAWSSGVAEVQALTTSDSGDADATWYPIISDGATGTQAMQTDAGLYFNPSTNVLTATGGYGVGSGATPTILFQDSDAPGSDKDVGWIEFGYVDGADGAENSDLWIEIIQAGAENTEILRFDESDDQWETTKTFEAATLTEGGNAVYNSSETPGGELGGTWASPTVDDTGITLTSITIGALLGVDSIDATGAVDMDYGSADVTDHTFTSDGGTTIIDGATITPSSADNPYVGWDETDGQDFYAIADDAGNEWELSRDSTVSQNNILVIAEDGSAYTFGDGGDDNITLTFDNDDTDGTIQRMADEKTWAINSIVANGVQTYDLSSVADNTDVTLGTQITGTVIVVTEDDDEDSSELDLQDGNVNGQYVEFIGGTGIDGTDTVTIDTTTDSTCTGCTTVLMDEPGDSFGCRWTGSTWNCYQLNEVP